MLQKSFVFCFGSEYISVLVLSSPVKCIQLNLKWPLIRSTYTWESWQSVIAQLCTIAYFRFLSSIVIAVVQNLQIDFMFFLSVILAYDVVLVWPQMGK